MAAGLFISPQRHFKASDGTPLSGYKLYTYESGTTTPLATYSDSNNTLNTNPIVLDSSGACFLYLQEDTPYSLVLKDPTGVTTLYTSDPIVNYKAIPDPGEPDPDVSYTDHYNLHNCTFSDSYDFIIIRPDGSARLYIEDFTRLNSGYNNLVSSDIRFHSGYGVSNPYNIANIVLRFGVTAAAVNYIKFTQTSTSLIIEPDGPDADIDLIINGSAGSRFHWGGQEGFNIFSSSDGLNGHTLTYNGSNGTMYWA